jgi:diacylglycerol O-acyltransferase
VNDVILALVTATIRHYCELHGDRIKGKLLRIMVPVNLRGNTITAELGNRISLVPVTIPLDIRQPGKLLAAIHRRTEFLKRMHAAELVSLAGGLLGMFPTSLQGMAGPLASQLPIAPFNLVCTNVPGPQVPLFLLGHKMLHCYPYVPVGGEMAVNCAILSYNGTVYFGFSGDTHAAPDLRLLEKFLQQSFAELRQTVGIRSQQRKTTRRRQTAIAPEVTPTVTAPILMPRPISRVAPEPSLPKQPEKAATELVVA